MTTVYTPQSRCRFGFARCDITPPVGIYHRMWGAAKQDQSTGIHRPLQASAMVLRPDDEATDDEQIVVVLDHVLLWANEMDRLHEQVCEATSTAAERLTITFTHTHAAGLIDTKRSQLPGGEHIEPYLKELTGKIVGLIGDARSHIQPATITYGTGRCRLAAHRDFWDKDSRQIVCGFNPNGEGDDTVLIGRVTDNKHKVIAVLVNYACHPTTLAWDNTLISPDFPGAMREVVETATDAPCVFLQGASGDLGPREGFVGDVETADKNGRQLGYAVLSELEAMPPPQTKYTYRGPVISGATIGVWQHETLASDETKSASTWTARRWTVALPYRPELPTLEKTRRDLADWQAKETDAIAKGDDAGARDCRAMIERMNRRLIRIESLPAGNTYPYPVTAWRIGDAVWIAVEGELYQWFQQSLRQEFPNNPIFVMTLSNGSRVSYLPIREAYGKGIYQETVACLAPGALESLGKAVREYVGELVG